ncbi:MAG TPA: ABC transporter ATP-binding protein [Mycobacteriales bacterium]|nr:ABC transporter ATP-binding protein [Mycobacteriales bacterium]
MTALLQIGNLRKTFMRDGRTTAAVAGVDLSVAPGETVGLIGESGSGKSTLGRLALMLLTPDSGLVEFEGEDLTRLRPRDLRSRRARMQIVFQEPGEALDPQLTIGQSVAEPLDVQRPRIPAAEKAARVAEALERVRLDPGMTTRYPSQLSGGQQQRVGIARAIITRPSLIVLDEPTSSLDLSVRAGIISLLQQLQSELGVAYLFISHDLTTVEYLAERLVVLYRGRIVEAGPTAELVAAPRHPYTQALVAARLDVDPRIAPLPLAAPAASSAATAVGCPYQSRCPNVQDDCRVGEIPLRPDDGAAGARELACLHPVPPATRPPLDLVAPQAGPGGSS